MGEESFVANLKVFVKSGQWYIFQHYNILVNLVILMAGFHSFIIAAKIAGKKLCDNGDFVKNISSCQRKHA